MNLKVPFLIPALLSVWISTAEKKPIVKIYAYSQATTRGLDPGKGAINEYGKEEIKNVKPGIHYLIYFEQSPFSVLKPEQVWIKGIGYSINGVDIIITPVKLESQPNYGQSNNDILVPETSNNVLQLIITGISKEPISNSSTLRKLISSSDLVVSYIWKEKRYYKAIKKIKMLEPLAAM